jgi:polyferredoxin
LLARGDFELSVLADRSPLYVQLSDGSVPNAYTVKILNKQSAARQYVLRITGLPGARLTIAGGDEAAAAAAGVTLTVKPDSVGTFRALLHAPMGAGHGEVPLEVVVQPGDGGGAPIIEPATFHGPAN